MFNLFDINKALERDTPSVIAQADKAYADCLYNIARDIYDHRMERPMILLSGPSGSGKTTTALKLEQLLDSWGCETHTLSMDNYFRPLTSEERGLAVKGLFDLESPTRVDMDLLNQQLVDMIAGCKVQLPRYDFGAAARIFTGEELTRRPGELVILEGIHALNRDIISIAGDRTVRLYVHVDSCVTDGKTILYPAEIRLMRRMVRDRLYRGRSFEETLRLSAGVERGEQCHILPHQHRAEREIDTFFAYELSAYRSLLYDDLCALPEDVRSSAEDIVQILSASVPIPVSGIPNDAMIREFIGRTN